MTNVAYILSLIAPLFSYLKEEDYVSMQQNLAWLDVRAAAGAPLQEALSLPTWPARSSFQNELLVPGMPLAAMPVESLYKAWSTQQGNAFGATRGLYLGDPARHLSQVYRELAIEVPAEFASMPDHLTLELELLALLLDAGNGEAARQLAADHLDWLDEYDAALACWTASRFCGLSRRSRSGRWAKRSPSRTPPKERPSPYDLPGVRCCKQAPCP